MGVYIEWYIYGQSKICVGGIAELDNWKGKRRCDGRRTLEDWSHYVLLQGAYRQARCAGGDDGQEVGFGECRWKFDAFAQDLAPAGKAFATLFAQTHGVAFDFEIKEIVGMEFNGGAFIFASQDTFPIPHTRTRATTKSSCGAGSHMPEYCARMRKPHID